MTFDEEVLKVLRDKETTGRKFSKLKSLILSKIPKEKENIPNHKYWAIDYMDGYNQALKDMMENLK